MMSGIHAAAAMARLLADPVRLMILQALGRQDASASELLAITGTTQTNLSNHLKLLRDNDLVVGERQGRQILYRICTPAIAEVVEALLMAVPNADDDPPPVGALAEARTCYDHLAGKLGVALLDGLVSMRALEHPGEGWAELEFGPAAATTFQRFGIDLETEVRAGKRRRLAYCCPDWSEIGHSHLGGLVGAILCKHCLQNGWISKDKETRVIKVTDSGKAALGWILS
jgi:DNA-binding transcriptional ArsR family regulator